MDKQQPSKILISQRRIQQRVRELGREIQTSANGGRELTFLVTMTGAMLFCADLLRAMPKTFPVKVEYTALHSYKGVKKQRTKSRLKLPANLKGRDIIVIEDIVDTGETAKSILLALKKAKVRSVKLCSLLSKPSCRKFKVQINYLGFEIDDSFVVGYGMDFNGLYRHLPDICLLN